MQIRLSNFDDKGCFWQREWSPAHFFDGTICRQDDLKEVRSITAQKEVRISELQQRISKWDKQSQEARSVEHEVMQKEMRELSDKYDYSEDMDEYETSLYDGQVTVRMAFGCYLGMGGERGEFLKLEGDARLISNLLPLIMLKQS